MLGAVRWRVASNETVPAASNLRVVIQLSLAPESNWRNVMVVMFAPIPFPYHIFKHARIAAEQRFYGSPEILFARS